MWKLILFVLGLSLSSFAGYIEYFGGSQLVPQVGDAGGLGGHAFVYVKGLCKDYSKKIPQVIPCSQLNNPTHDGVGISLNSQNKNFPWVAVPDRELFLYGTKQSQNAVTSIELNRVIDKAVELKIYDTLELHEGVLAPKYNVGSKAYERRIVANSVGTDIAINWGRDLEVVKIPVPDSILGEVAKYLNNFNNSFYLNKKPYVWSMLKNNCTHLAVNVMASAGLTDFIPHDLALPKSLFNLAIPQNGLYLAQEIANFSDKSYAELLRNPKKMDIFLEHSWIPGGGPGSLNSTIPAVRTNELFKTNKLRVVAAPRKSSFCGELFENLKMRNLSFKDPRFRTLEKNLEYWSTKLTKTLKKSHRWGISSSETMYKTQPLYQVLTKYKKHVEHLLNKLTK